MNTYYALIVPIILTALLSGCGGNSKPQSAGQVVPPAASSSQIPAEKEASLTYYLPTEDGLHILPATVKVKAADRTAKTARSRKCSARIESPSILSFLPVPA